MCCVVFLALRCAAVCCVVLCCGVFGSAHAVILVLRVCYAIFGAWIAMVLKDTVAGDCSYYMCAVSCCCVVCCDSLCCVSACCYAAWWVALCCCCTRHHCVLFVHGVGYT